MKVNKILCHTTKEKILRTKPTFLPLFQGNQHKAVSYKKYEKYFKS